MTHDVFISYSSKDKEIANAIREFLEKKGIVCWIAPRNIPPGATYAESIIGAINKCRLVILVFSSNANQSGDVQNEIERASQKEKTIIPFRIDNTTLSESFEYHLSKFQWFDATTSSPEDHFQSLANSVIERLSLNKELEVSPIPPMPPGIDRPASNKKPRWLLVSLLSIPIIAAVAAAVYIFILRPPPPPWGIVIGTDDDPCAANDERSKATKAGYKADIYSTTGRYRTVIAGDAGNPQNMLKQVQKDPNLSKYGPAVFSFASDCPNPVKVQTSPPVTCIDYYFDCK